MALTKIKWSKTRQIIFLISGIKGKFQNARQTKIQLKTKNVRSQNLGSLKQYTKTIKTTAPISHSNLLPPFAVVL